jgi:hypothetical protein
MQIRCEITVTHGLTHVHDITVGYRTIPLFFLMALIVLEII